MSTKKTTTITDKINALRELMQINKSDALIIPSGDAHISEYRADFFKEREWISGFTGSAGTFVLTARKAGLWTDSRYFLQAEKELKIQKLFFSKKTTNKRLRFRTGCLKSLMKIQASA